MVGWRVLVLTGILAIALVHGNDSSKLFSMGGYLSHAERFQKTLECLAKSPAESPWVFSVPNYCAELSCEIWETPNTKAVQFNTKICEKESGFKPACYEEDLSLKYPECCPKRKSDVECNRDGGGGDKVSQEGGSEAEGSEGSEADEGSEAEGSEGSKEGEEQEGFEQHPV